MTGIEIATIVSIGVNVLTGIFAKRQRKKAKLLPVLIRGVEAAAGNESVKSSIKSAALAAGVDPDLHKEVKRITSKLGGLRGLR